MATHKTVKFEANGVNFRITPNEAIELGIKAFEAVYPQVALLLRAARDGTLYSALHHHRQGTDHFWVVADSSVDFIKALMEHDPEQFELNLPDESIETSQMTLSMLTPIDLAS